MKLARAIALAFGRPDPEPEEFDYSPEFRARMGMIVHRAKAEAIGNTGRSVTLIGPDGPLWEGAATALAHFHEQRINEEETA